MRHLISSNTQVDYPRPLSAKNSKHGGRTVRGDVDLEFIFKKQMSAISDKKAFKREIVAEISDAVQCRHGKVKVREFLCLSVYTPRCTGSSVVK